METGRKLAKVGTFVLCSLQFVLSMVALVSLAKSIGRIAIFVANVWSWSTFWVYWSLCTDELWMCVPYLVLNCALIGYNLIMAMILFVILLFESTADQVKFVSRLMTIFTGSAFENMLSHAGTKLTEANVSYVLLSSIAILVLYSIFLSLVLVLVVKAVTPGSPKSKTADYRVKVSTKEAGVKKGVVNKKPTKSLPDV